MRALILLTAAISLLGASSACVEAQDFYKGKTVTMFAGQPPGGGIDSEMRLVAHYLGKFIPGEPTVVARNMQGAGGVVLGNHLFGVARPDGLTLGMPGRSGFVLAPVTSAGDVKYDLRKFTWIGSSASTNYILWLRRTTNIRTLAELKAAKGPIVIGGSGAGTANSVVPEVLAKYENLPFKVVRGYPGTSQAVLAMERGEVDGVFLHRASMRPDLVASGMSVPVFQTLWPVRSQPPSVRTARVVREARSEPAPGSLNSWHQCRSPRRVGGTKASFCSWVPCARIVGSAQSPMISRGWVTPDRSYSCWITSCSTGVAARP